MIPKRSSQTIQNILSTRNNVMTNRISTRTRTSTSTSTSTRTITSLYHNIAGGYNSNSNLSRSTNKRTIFGLPTSASTSTLTSTSALFQQTRKFNTESEYHNQADDTLNTIQDTLEYYFEDHISTISSSSSNVGFEINFASGVLTIALLPTHGTWVLNKQTPNKQIWWSSPLSGPRRYEWDEQLEKWVWTKYVDYCSASASGDGSGDGSSSDWNDTISLGEALKTEMIQLFQIHDGLEELDDL